MSDDEDTDPNGRAPQRPARPRSPYESGDRRGDTTSPIALLERDLDPADAVLAERLRETDPAVLAVRLARQLERDRRRDKHDSDELSNQVAVAIDDQRKTVEGLERSVDSLLSSRKLATKIAGGIIGGVFAALVVVAQALWARAEGEGALKTEIHHMQRTLEKTVQQLEDLQRSFDRKGTP